MLFAQAAALMRSALVLLRAWAGRVRCNRDWATQVHGCLLMHANMSSFWSCYLCSAHATLLSPLHTPRLGCMAQPTGACAVLQRRLLERLAALAASVLGGHVPVAVVALDAVGRLLEVLGEVPAEVRALRTIA